MLPKPTFLIAAILGLANLVACACNGEDALCDRQYSNITLYVKTSLFSATFPPLHNLWNLPLSGERLPTTLTPRTPTISVGAHDSAFVGPLLTQNQKLNVSEQLAMGVRFLQAQTHSQDDGIEMCHTDCLLLDAGPLTDYLAPVKTFLDANADEVVTMLLTNGDAIAVSEFAAVFESTGLAQYTFAPNKTLALDAWPTLQQMIDNGTRLVVWMGEYRNQPTICE